MTREQMKAAIGDIPPSGWWSTSSRERFEDLADRLVNLGLRPEAAVEFLTDAYGAVANEFGS